MSYVATGFWLGVTIGRLMLGFPAARYGEKRMVLIYTFMALCIQFVFWFVPSVPVSAVSVALIGFFIGPIFPCTVALATKVLPGHLHVSVIGFIAAFGRPFLSVLIVGSLGAALIPFSAGVLAQTKGVKTLMPLLVALEVAMLGIWVFVPTKSRLD
jgi:fucose permease